MASKKAQREARRRSGLCLHCPAPLKTKWECVSCARASRRRALIRQREKLAGGLCVVCGKDPAVRARQCSPCREATRASWQRSVERRIAEGLCSKCRRPRAPGNASFCVKHRRWYRSATAALKHKARVLTLAAGCTDCGGMDRLRISAKFEGLTLCHPCWRLRLRAERLVHGTIGAYERWDCRCAACVECFRATARRYYARRRKRATGAVAAARGESFAGIHRSVDPAPRPMVPGTFPTRAEAEAVIKKAWERGR